MSVYHVQLKGACLTAGITRHNVVSQLVVADSIPFVKIKQCPFATSSLNMVGG